jgi:hypothetical protein
MTSARRRDIALAGELAGMPARDAPKPYGDHVADISQCARGCFMNDDENYFA